MIGKAGCYAKVFPSPTVPSATFASSGRENPQFVGDSEQADEEADEGDRDNSVAAHLRGGEARRDGVTLFVDGITENVGYQQFKALFSQHGKPEKVFVQRERKKGRRFRFGFVRFLTKSCADMAIKVLDGVRVGGAFLSVAVARFPSVGVSAISKEVGSLPCSPVKKQSCLKGWQENKAGSHGCALSWRNVLMGEIKRPKEVSFSQGEECLVRGQVCSCDLSYRIQVEDLFRKHSTCGW